MPKVYRPKEAMKMLEYLGWRLVKVSGSHYQYKLGGSKVPIPMHNRELGHHEMRTILQRAGLTKQEWDTLADEVL